MIHSLHNKLGYKMLNHFRQYSRALFNLTAVLLALGGCAVATPVYKSPLPEREVFLFNGRYQLRVSPYQIRGPLPQFIGNTCLGKARVIDLRSGQAVPESEDTVSGYFRIDADLRDDLDAPTFLGRYDKANTAEKAALLKEASQPHASFHFYTDDADFFAIANNGIGYSSGGTSAPFFYYHLAGQPIKGMTGGWWGFMDSHTPRQYLFFMNNELLQSSNSPSPDTFDDPGPIGPSFYRLPLENGVFVLRSHNAVITEKIPDHSSKDNNRSVKLPYKQTQIDQRTLSSGQIEYGPQDGKQSQVWVAMPPLAKIQTFNCQWVTE